MRTSISVEREYRQIHGMMQYPRRVQGYGFWISCRLYRFCITTNACAPIPLQWIIFFYFYYKYEGVCVFLFVRFIFGSKHCTRWNTIQLNLWQVIFSLRTLPKISNCLSQHHSLLVACFVTATYALAFSCALLCLSITLLLLSHVPCFVSASRCSCSLMCLALSQHHAALALSCA